MNWLIAVPFFLAVECSSELEQCQLRVAIRDVALSVYEALIAADLEQLDAQRAKIKLLKKQLRKARRNEKR